MAIINGASAERKPSSVTQAEVELYERLMPMLTAAHREMSELSKKKQDGVLNTLKIRNINRLLENLTPLLSERDSFGLLEKLDEETIPQNSDAVLLLSQWDAALKELRRVNYGFDGKRERWFTIENPRT